MSRCSPGGAACTKALHTSTTPGKGSDSSCTREVTGDGVGGTHVALAWASSSPSPPSSWRHAWEHLAASSTH